MQVNKSIILTALVPSAIHNREIFAESVRLAAAKGINTIEYYCEPVDAADRGGLLREHQLKGIYLAAYYQKKHKINLSSTDDKERGLSVETALRSIDAALESGADRVLLSSGMYPADRREEAAAWDALGESLDRLLAYTQDGLVLSLEPGDREVQAMQLSGPTDKTLDLAAELGKDHGHFRLTMDTSHIKQLEEDPYASLLAAAPYCDHIHLANCVLEKTSPLYGDQHPSFDTPGAVYTREQLAGLASFILENYKHPELIMGIEVIASGGIDALHGLLETEKWFVEGNLSFLQGNDCH